MDRNRRLLAVAVLLLCMMLTPVCVFAQTAVGDSAKQVCLTAGGRLIEPAKAMCVASPYGTQSLVLRSEPSDSYDAVAMLRVGQEITVYGEFYCVLLSDGVCGWLANDVVKE